MNQRGQYGRNGFNSVPLMGQQAHPTTVYVEREHSSVGKWILGTIVVGGALLWARHQSKQMEAIYKSSGLPYQSFAGGLYESAKSIPSRAKATYRSLTSSSKAAPVATPAAAVSVEPVVDQPAHSVRSRPRAR